MPRTPSLPKYRRHKSWNLAVVTVRQADGSRRDVYLGKYNSPESRVEYARVIAELAHTGTATSPSAGPTIGHPAGKTPTANEVFLLFLTHAERHYRREDGTHTNELKEYRLTIRTARELYGNTPAGEFGPLALKAVRARMVAGVPDTEDPTRRVGPLCRTTANNRIRRLKHIFKWAASEQLVPVGTYQALATVSGLQKGRTDAREPDPIEPADDYDVRSTLPFVRPAVLAMVEVQLLTGMRPGEVCRLRPADLDTTGPVWFFRPRQHKKRHLNKSRVIAIGPKAQEILRPFTPSDPAAYYFNPRVEVERLHAERTANRKTPKYASHMKRNTAKRIGRWGKRRPAEVYTTTSFDHAILRGVERANAAREKEKAEVGPNRPPVARWTPNQLRHTHATEVRRKYGLEGAGAALGHDQLTTTLIYAERNLDLAARIAGEIG